MVSMSSVQHLLEKARKADSVIVSANLYVTAYHTAKRCRSIHADNAVAFALHGAAEKLKLIESIDKEAARRILGRLRG